MKNAGWIALGLGLIGLMLWALFRKPAAPRLVAGSTLPTSGSSWIGGIVGSISRDISTAIGGSDSFSVSVSQPAAKSGAASGAAGYTAAASAGPNDSAAVYQPGDSFQDYATGLFGAGIDTGVA